MDDTNPTKPESEETRQEAGKQASVSEGSPASDAGPEVIAFDLTASSGLDQSEATAVEALHKGCAADLSAAIGGAVGSDVTVELKSVVQQSYGEFQEALPAGSYVATNTLRPLGEDIAIWMDPGLALPVVDLLLGGTGTAGEIRELTVIEAQILENVVGFASRALQVAWRPMLDQAFVFGRRIRADEVVSVMASGEPVVLLSFEVAIAESTGTLGVALNPVVSNALLRKLAVAAGGVNRREPSGVSERLGHHILNTPFAVEVVLPQAPVPARRLIGLKVGDVLTLPQPIDQPATIVVAGRPMLSGMPVRYERSRAVEVLARLGSDSGDPRKESA